MMNKIRTLTACDICGKGYPYGDLVRYTDGRKVCKECSEMQIDIRANGELTTTDRIEVQRFIKHIKDKNKLKLLHK